MDIFIFSLVVNWLTRTIQLLQPLLLLQHSVISLNSSLGLSSYSSLYHTAGPRQTRPLVLHPHVVTGSSTALDALVTVIPD